MGFSKKPQDATRQERKAKKRKLENAVPDLPGDEQEQVGQVGEKKSKKRKREEDAEMEAENVEYEKELKKKLKKEKKRRRKEAEVEHEGGVEIEAEAVSEALRKAPKKERKSTEGKETAAVEVEPEVEDKISGGEGKPKKSKKERKAERKAKDAGVATDRPVEKSTLESENKGDKTNGDVASTEEKKSKKNNRNRERKRKGVTASEGEGTAVDVGDESKDDKKDARFICFIGNLPFTANTQSITKHFAAVKPISVRALTQKDDPKKSKGIAFVEFEGYDHMKTCLKTFHHSTFDDGLSAPRKINVELTAGGGGNTKDRKAKIQDKNQKLNEQRARRIQEEAKVRLEKSTNAAAIDETAIHPSRRTRVPVV